MKISFKVFPDDCENHIYKYCKFMKLEFSRLLSDTMQSNVLYCRHLHGTVPLNMYKMYCSITYSTHSSAHDVLRKRR